MKQSCKLISIMMIILFLVVSTSIFANSQGNLNNFVKIKEFNNNFEDVDLNSWYYENVKTAYEYGLVNGNSETTFNPIGCITLAETITLASRLNNTYIGANHVFETTTPWYQSYVDYAIEKGIISQGQYNDYNVQATRAEFVEIIAKAIAEKDFNKINNITIIPDVFATDKYAYEVYMLYNAGILSGSDEKGTFNPNSNIQRSEVAAILTRITNKELRKSFTLSNGNENNIKDSIITGWYSKQDNDYLIDEHWYWFADEEFVVEARKEYNKTTGETKYTTSAGTYIYNKKNIQIYNILKIYVILSKENVVTDYLYVDKESDPVNSNLKMYIIEATEFFDKYDEKDAKQSEDEMLVIFEIIENSILDYANNENNNKVETIAPKENKINVLNYVGDIIEIMKNGAVHAMVAGFDAERDYQNSVRCLNQAYAAIVATQAKLVLAMEECGTYSEMQKAKSELQEIYDVLEKCIDPIHVTRSNCYEIASQYGQAFDSTRENIEKLLELSYEWE